MGVHASAEGEARKEVTSRKLGWAGRKPGNCSRSIRAAHPNWIYRKVRNLEAKLITGELDAAGFDGFGEAPADKTENGGGGIAFGF
jgi:hypothetical protein